jgi:hypothetical protein
VSFSYVHRMGNKKSDFWNKMLGDRNKEAELRYFVKEACLVPASEKKTRERALGLLMNASMLALRRPEWQPPEAEDANAYWHFAGKEGLRFM